MATVDADKAESKVASSDTGELDNQRSDTLAPDDVNDIANRKTLPASINGEPQAPNKSTEKTTEIETNQSTEDAAPQDSNPPLPSENPPLPQEEPPDDGWEPRWDPNYQAYYFYHAATNISQWENPRVPAATQYPSSVNPAQGAVCRFYWNQYPIQTYNYQLSTSSSAAASSSSPVKSGAAGRYNPSIHGSWDPTADYAKEVQAAGDTNEFPVNPDVARDYIQAAHFNRWTGQNQQSTDNKHSDEAKSKRQMEAFFNVDLAANSHEGRSLKAERQSKKLTRKEVREYQERRREKKEEKRRAWLRD